MGKTVAVIVAAGSGKRMAAGINKQFIKLKGKPLLYYTLKAFSDISIVDEIVLVCAKDEIKYCQEEVVGKYNINKVTHYVEGGQERQQSVYNGLRAIKNCDLVIIHDGARPFVSNSIISNGVKFAQIYGACTCGVSPKDTIKVKGDMGFSERTLNRQSLFSVQTPQCFKYKLILECYEKLSDKTISFTDDTSVAEYFGNKVFLYDGSYNNIKITTPEDLALAESILSNEIL